MKSHTISTEEAINRIWESVVLQKKQNQNIDIKPYFFLVGAGISMPEIKGANEIILECQDVVKELCTDNIHRFEELKTYSEKFKNDSSKYYSFWFEAAFKNKINRQKYLETIITNARISAANLLLAQILVSKEIATSVITPNFDDKLIQALILYGEHDIFEADNLFDNMSINPASKQIQIIHVHGTYRFYDCCNLENEIQKVSSEMGIRSTASVIDDYLKYMVPIVIGYSGWEDDVIMSRIKERIKYPLPYNIIWFCYDYNSYDNLPDWLKKCEDICFVLPELENECGSISMIGSFSASLENHIENLKATDVFSAIISKFSISMPNIFANPFKYYSELFSRLITTDEKDVFNLNGWISRLKFIESSFTELDKIIKNIDEVVAKKNISEINKSIKDILQLDIVPQTDIRYILANAILPMLRIRYKAENFDSVFEFCVLSLEIFKLGLDITPKIENMNDVLDLLLYNVSRMRKKVNGLDFYNNVLSIISIRSEYIVSKLTAKGLKSDLLSLEEKNILQEEIIKEGEKYKENETIVRLLIVTFYKIALRDETKSDIYLLNIKSLIDLHSSNLNLKRMYYNIKLELLKKYNNTFESYEQIIMQIKREKIIDFNGICANAYYNEIQIIEEINKRKRICNKALKLMEQPEYIRNDCEETFTYLKILTELVSIKLKTKNEFNRELLDKVIEAKKQINYCKSASENVIRLINLYIRDNKNEEENIELYKYIISICEENKTENSFIKRKIDTVRKLVSLLEGNEKEEIFIKYPEYNDYEHASELVSTGLDEYVKGNIHNSFNIFNDANILGNKIVGEEFYVAKINMAYILRRKEYVDNHFKVMELLEVRIAEDDAFRCINLALCYVQGVETDINWSMAFDIIQNTYDPEDALRWWSDFSRVGDIEGLQVLFLLYFSKLIDKDDLPFKFQIFIELCLEKLDIPQEYIEKYLIQ